MATKIFVNLPVKNLKKSMEFFTSLGCTFDMSYTDEKGACLVISDDVYCMLMEAEYFYNFTTRKGSGRNKSNEVVFSLARDSREEVDEILEKAVRAGGREFRKPIEYGWLYGRGFEDLDGHLWQIYLMNTEQPGQY